jgi:hypothetical protein
MDVYYRPLRTECVLCLLSARGCVGDSLEGTNGAIRRHRPFKLRPHDFLPQSTNTFPHQQRSDRGLRPGARTLCSRHSVLVEVAGNGVCGLSLRVFPHNAGHHLVWLTPIGDWWADCAAYLRHYPLTVRSSHREPLDRGLGDLQQRLKIVAAGHPQPGSDVLDDLLGRRGSCNY